MKKNTIIRLCSSVIIILLIMLTYSCKKDDNTNHHNYGTMTDIDGNIYKTITIGTQTWMAENLKVTHYRNGNSLPNITIDTIWSKLTTGAYCDYENKTSNKSIYGILYNWYAVQDSQNIAPIGWHVPTMNEWKILSDYLGGESFSGNKLKESGTAHWQISKDLASNESGFTGLPGGYRDCDSGAFHNIGTDGYWWSSTEWYLQTNKIITFLLTYGVPNLYSDLINKTNGLSIRCVKDQ